MAKSKNLRITSDEYKIVGTLNAEDLENMVVESEEGEVPLTEIIKNFDGAEVEFALKKKIEQPLA